ncbi:MAG: Ig-like domain-containing protein [Breznakibacter sp.]
MIFENTGISVLDPNGDGYVSKSPNGFAGNDQSGSEIPYVPIVFPSNEPNSDLGPGPDCGFTDFVQQSVGIQDAGQQYFDLAGNNWLFRIRLGGTSPNSKSYSILIDTDQRFGDTSPNADPNYVSGNPGFEIEIVLATNFGVLVYDVDGKTSPVLKRTYNIATHHHKAIALSTECGTPDYFYDFYVPFANLTTDFGITSSTPVRIVLLDNMAANTSSISKPNSISDIGGIDDAIYGGNLQSAFNDIINNYTPTCSTCPAGLDRSACPVITGNYTSSSTSILGTSSEANGTIIQVYINGVAAGAAVSVSGGTWIKSGVALGVGNVITATAAAPGKGTSIGNCSSRTVTDCVGTVNAPVFSQVRTGGKEVEFKVDAPSGAVVGVYTASTNVLATGSNGALTNNPLTISTYNSSLLRVIGQSSGNNTLPSGSYYLKTTYNGCESTYTYFCHNLTASTVPTVATNPITPNTTQIAGNGTSASSTILIFKNEKQIASGTSAASSPYAFNIGVSGLALCDQITVRQISAGMCVSNPTTSVTVTSAAATPGLLQESCISASLSTVKGVTSESPANAMVKLYSYTAPSTYTAIAGASSVAANGVWTFTPTIAISAGTTIVATVTNTSGCKTESAYSSAVTLVSAPTIGGSTAINNPVTEDDVTISGTGVDGQWIQLYVDDAIPYKMISGNLTAIGRVQVVGGVWVVSVDNYSIYAGAKLRVSVANASMGGCESALSLNSVTVLCVAPSVPTYVGGDKSYCNGGEGSVVLAGSEQGVVYQLVNGAGVAVGATKAGNGGSITLHTYPLTANLTSVYVKAFGLLNTNCAVVSSTPIDFDISLPSPDIVLSNNNVAVLKGSTSVPFVYSSPTNGPTHYNVVFSIAAKNQGFVDVPLTTLPASPIPITVPAGAAVGSYSAVMNISNATSCSVAKSITITIYESGSAPIVTQHPSDKTVCAGNGTSFSVTATGTPTFYQWQYSTNGGYSWSNVLGSTYSGATSATLTIVNVAGLNGYKYNCVVGNAGGNTTSDYTLLTVLPYPSFTVNPTNQTVCSPNNSGFSVSQEGATALKWQVDAGSGFTDIADGGIYNGVTTSILSIANTSGLNGYKYRAVAMTNCASVNSSAATLNVNNCLSPVVSLSAGTLSIGEGDGSIAITATLSSVAALDVTVTLGYSGTADAEDYNASHTIVIPAGQLSASILLTVTNDAIYESNETVSVEITNVDNATENGEQSLTISIVDDEAVPIIAIADASAIEGNDLEFVITLSNGSVQPITINYTTVDGTAAAGVDYVGRSGALEFVPGDISQNLVVPTIQDGLVEGSEAFFVSLSGASNAVIGNATGIGTIIDDDSYPVAVADSYVVLEGGVLSIDAPGVLINDHDADGDALSAILVRDVAYGSLTLSANGSFVYIQDGDDSDSDSFTYLVNDGVNNGNSVTVTISITPVNDMPSFTKGPDQTVNEDAGAQTITNWATNLSTGAANESNQTLTFVVTNDYNTLFSAQPAIDASGTLTYTPALNAYGVATVSVLLKDDGGTANGGVDTYTVQTFSITVVPVNDSPVGEADEYDVAMGATLNVGVGEGVLANDADAEGNTLSSLLVSGPAHGTLAFNSDGSFTYTHDGSATYVDTFTYRATDGSSQSDAVTVTINVTGVNNKPVASADAYSVGEGGTLGVDAPGVLGNDTDADGDALSAVLVSPPSHGTLTLGPDGSFVYVHDGSETLSDTFSYRAFDGKQNGNVMAVSISIEPRNDAPVANPDSYAVGEGGTLSVAPPGVLGNDSDAEGDALSAVWVSGPGYGTLALNADGSFTYIHDGSETTNDSFAYKVNDGTEDSNTVVVSITVTSVNDVPVAMDDEYSAVAGGTLNVDAANGVLRNDTDADNVALVAVLVSTVSNGTLMFNADGSFRYTHNGSITYADSFTYRASDGDAQSNLVTVNITITGVNNQPVANGDHYFVVEGGVLNIVSPGILNNDTDADGDALTAILVSNTANGVLMLNPDGSFTYTHNGNETTFDSFAYQAYDGKLAGNVATVSISVTPVNDTPVAVADSYTVYEGGQLSVDSSNGLLANDTDAENDALTAILVDGPTHGTLVLAADGSFTYTHDGSETTSDNFTYKVNDGIENGNTVIVSITVVPVNDSPVGEADEYDVAMGATLNVGVGEGVLANDADAEGNTLSSLLVSGPAHGILAFNSDGSFTYTHDGSATYVDTFTYRATDGSSQSDAVTVTINVTGVNNKPVASADAYSVGEGGTLGVDAPGVLGNDTDADGDALSAVLVSPPSHGTLTLGPDGSFVYVHDGSETLSDTFSYRAFDGKQNGNVMAVSISIEPRNDAPVANPDSYAVGEGGTLSVAPPGVLGNDSDAEGDALSAVWVSGPGYGTLALNADGSFTYIHDGSETTNDSFIYKVTDGATESNAVTVAIVINPVNDVPVATAVTVNVNANSNVSGNLMANVTDAENDALFFYVTPVSGPSNGQITLGPDGSYTYVPNNGFVGTDTVEIRVCDLYHACTVLIVSLNVSEGNLSPVVNNTVISVEEDGQINESLLPLVSDPDNDPITVNIAPVVAPLHGELTIYPDGTYTYTPDANYYGTDGFVFGACDSRGVCAQGTVSITVVSVNDAPVSAGNTYEVLEDGLVSDNLSLYVTDADGDPLTISTNPVVGPQHGTLTIYSDGTFVYTPDVDYHGADNFVYEVCDSHGSCTQSVVHITVVSVNDVPVAINDTVFISENQYIEIEVLLNDLNLGDGGLVVSIIRQPQHGSATVLVNGAIGYQPHNGFKGVDFFTYRVCDENGDCAETEVLVNATGEELIIPHGFSPNGDGVNDFFVIPDLSKFTKVGIEIINRWGNVVYKKSTYENNWDGQSNIGFSIGKELPAGTYFYIITIHDIDKAYSGYVYLNR